MCRLVFCAVVRKYGPIPVAALAGIVGSNPTGGKDVCRLYSVCVLSGRGLCDGPIPRPEESYRMWCVFECDQVKNTNRLHLL
jgi:hypothetical protein